MQKVMQIPPAKARRSVGMRKSRRHHFLKHFHAEDCAALREALQELGKTVTEPD